MAFDKLKVSEEVGGETFVASVQTTAATASQKVRIHDFIPSAVYSKLEVVRLVWAYGLAEERELWTSKGGEPYPHALEIDGNDSHPPDGARKIGVICENADIDPVYMSAMADVENK